MKIRIEKLIENVKIFAPYQKKLRRLLTVGTQAIILHSELQYKMVAIGLTKNKEVFIGYPKIKTHPFFKRYHAEYLAHSKVVHAEGDLVLKCMDKELDIILVIRLGKSRNSCKEFFRMAKPCASCEHVLSDFQPHAKVFYTSHEGTILPFIP
jgi:cytidine deaminase